MTTTTARRIVRAVVIGGVAVAGVCSVTLEAQRESSAASKFAVAILRRDGVLIPFADFDGTRWGEHWPRPDGDVPAIPVTLSATSSRWWGSVAPQADWLLTGVASPRTIHVRQPDWVTVHCQRQIGLRTDYRSTDFVPPPTVQPFPKDGVAVAPPHPIDPIEIVPPEEGASKLTGLRHALNIEERVIEYNDGHPFSRRTREPMEPTVEAIYAYGQHPRTYYVEASRTYRNARRCVALAFMHGWFVDDGVEGRWRDVKAQLLNCDRYGAGYMLPLGGVDLGGRRYWIGQFAAWNGERYVIIELKKDSVEVVVNVSGGEC